MPPKLKFSDGEKVLCFHGPLIYEAKCLKSSVTKEKTVKYLIHYAGWNKNWDEWVPESRVLKFNDVNVQRQKEVQKAHSSQSTSAKKKSATKPKKGESGGKDGDSRSSTPSLELPIAAPVATVVVAQKRKAATPSSGHDSGSDVPRKKRGRTDTSVETEEQFISKIEVKIKIPDELTTWLVDDWDAINRQRKLLNLPLRNTVQSIIDEYIQQKQTSKSHSPNKESALMEVARGILEYFNVLLGTQLLYRFERPQYAEILQKHPDTKVSKIYGAIHLLRLFVKIGTIVAHTQLDDKSIASLTVHVQDFLKYLVKNSTTLFSMDDYMNSSPEYHRKTQG